MAAKADFSRYLDDDDEAMGAESKKIKSSAEADWSTRPTYSRPASASTASTAARAPQPTEPRDGKGKGKGGATTND